MATKWCPRCKDHISVDLFGSNKHNKDGLTNYCRVHHREVHAENAQRRRIELLNWLGGKCVRCGFTDWRALQVDHVNGGGRAETTTLTIAKFYKRIKEHPEDYQVLCANCNWIKRYENQELPYGNLHPSSNCYAPVSRRNLDATSVQAGTGS